MKYSIQILTTALIIAFLSACSTPPPQLDVAEVWPQAYSPDKKYVIFMHGNNVYKTSDAGTAEREKNRMIAEQIAALGYSVILDQRDYGVKVYDHSLMVAKRIKQMIADGVPASHITVMGFSSGSNGAFYIAATLLNPELGYVYLAGCHQRISGFPRGEMLALYERRDGQEFGSCESQVAKVSSGVKYEEKMYDTGTGHKFFTAYDELWGADLKAWLQAER